MTISIIKTSRAVPVVLCALAAAMLGVIYRAPLIELWAIWQTPDYSHGPLIPPLAALLLLNRLRGETARPSWWGVSLQLPAALMLLLGILSTFNALALYGLVVSLLGLFVAALGVKAAQRHWPPFVYLLFAIPLPNILYAGLSSDLQLISSTLGVAILDFLGIAVFQDGNIIDLGSFKLQVVDACSGLRYLFPLLSFGYLAAYLIEDRFWKRAILLLSTIPITIGMNSLRIALIGVTVSLWGQHMAEGLIHDFEGWTVFLVCVAILWGEMALLLRLPPRGYVDYDRMGFRRLFPLPRSTGKGQPVAASLTLLGVMTIGIVFGLRGYEGTIIPEHRALAGFPLTVDSWRGAPGSLDRDVLGALQLSDYWIGDYRRPESAVPINFYIAYYASQRAGSATHSPSSCIPGGGWQIVGDSIKPVAAGNGIVLTVRRILIKKGSTTQIVYYWFDERGRDLTDGIAVKWWMISDSIFEHRSDGSLIRLVAPVFDGIGEQKTEEEMADLLRSLYPSVLAYLPAPPGNAPTFF